MLSDFAEGATESVVEVAELMPEVADQADLARRALVALLDPEDSELYGLWDDADAGGLARRAAGPRPRASLRRERKNVQDAAAGGRECPAMGVTDFPTKIAVVVRDDLATWQRLNVTAFLMTGIAATGPEGTVGPNYEDADGVQYLPMLRQPVLVYEASAEALRKSHRRALEREAELAIYTHELFATGHDDENRAAVKAVRTEDLDLVGLAIRAPHRQADQILRGLKRHPAAPCRRCLRRRVRAPRPGVARGRDPHDPPERARQVRLVGEPARRARPPPAAVPSSAARARR